MKGNQSRSPGRLASPLRTPQNLLQPGVCPARQAASSPSRMADSKPILGDWSGNDLDRTRLTPPHSKSSFSQVIMLVPYNHTNMARGQRLALTGQPLGGPAASEGPGAKPESPRRVKSGMVGNKRDTQRRAKLDGVDGSGIREPLPLTE